MANEYKYIIEVNNLIKDLQKEYMRDWLLKMYDEGRLSIYIDEITQLDY